MQNMVKNDTRLLEASLTGDREAFGEIVQRYQGLICAITYSVTGDLALSEDLAQETFITAWRRLAGLRDRSRLRAWLCGIARNLAKNCLRRRGRDLAQRATPLDHVAEPSAAAPSPLDHTIAKEQEATLWRALEEIPPTYREPLVLYYRQHKSALAVAEALELSEDAVKQRLSRGRKMLKQQVATLVEETLARTRPTKALTMAILAALPAAAPQAAAAGVAATVAKGSTAAKAAAAVGLWGAVIGPLIGILGAAVGVTASIVNTRSPRERRFMVKLSGVTALYVLGFLGVLFPTIWGAKSLIAVSPWLLAALLFLECALYLAGLVTLILWGNRRQRQIQIEDGTRVDPKEAAKRYATSPNGFAGAIYGSVLGSLCWIVVISVQTNDWLTAGLVSAVGWILSALSAGACRRKPDRYWRVIVADMTCVAALSLLVVNLRFNAWKLSYTGSTQDFPWEGWTRWGVNGLLSGILGILLLAFLIRGRNSVSRRGWKKPRPAAITKTCDWEAIPGAC